MSEVKKESAKSLEVFGMNEDGSLISESIEFVFEPKVTDDLRNVVGQPTELDAIAQPVKPNKPTKPASPNKPKDPATNQSSVAKKSKFAKELPEGMEAITVQIKRVKWTNDSEESPFSIVECRSGITATVPIIPKDIIYTHMSYTLVGRFEVKEKFGRQFKATSITEERPLSKESVCQFLAKHCHGIGETKAIALWDEFGIELIETMIEHPQLIVESGLLPREDAFNASRMLRENQERLETIIEIESLLAGRGLGKQSSEIIWRAWGVNSPKVIRRDPYRMMSFVPGAGFKRCDRIYLDNGGNPDATKRLFLAGYDALSQDQTGSTWVEKTKAESLMHSVIESLNPAGKTAKDYLKNCEEIDLVKQIKQRDYRIAKAIELGKRTKRIAEVYEGGRYFIATDKSEQNEETVRSFVESKNILEKEYSAWGMVADEIRQLISTNSLQLKFAPSEHQLGALHETTKLGIGCLVGGPGTGKTTTIAALLRICQNRSYRTMLVAPTGKAAIRMRQSLQANGIRNIETSTIHSAYYRFLIQQSIAQRDGGSLTCYPADVIIIDECSMIDLSLMAMFLEKANLSTRVVLIGDTYQLPPVGGGAPFRDIINSKMVPVGELTEVRRNSGLIVETCKRIKNFEPVEIPEKLALDDENPVNLAMIDTDSPEASVNALMAILGKVKRFDKITETQIIVARNEKSPISRVELNKKLSEYFNPSDKNPFVEGCDFRVGDKIICTKNGQLQVAFRMNDGWGRGKDTTMIANGEMGFVIFAHKDYFVCEMETGSKIFMLNMRRPDSTKAKQLDKSHVETSESKATIDMAWAITVHRSQGSEWPFVVLIVDRAAGMIADSNYWYTGISRAKQGCLLIGSRSDFVTQVSKRKIDQRKTFLNEAIRGIEIKRIPWENAWDRRYELGKELKGMKIPETTIEALRIEPGLIIEPEQATEPESNGDH